VAVGDAGVSCQPWAVRSCRFLYKRYRTLASCRSRIDQAVVAAFYAGMMLVARDQKHGMCVSVWKDSHPGNLSSIIYREREGPPVGDGKLPRLNLVSHVAWTKWAPGLGVVVPSGLNNTCGGWQGCGASGDAAPSPQDNSEPSGPTGTA